jgi:hypothetical protein
MKTPSLLLCALLASGCSTVDKVTGIFTREKPPVAPTQITDSDMRQARWVDNAIAQDTSVVGKYQVVPGGDNVTVLFDLDLPPEQEARFRTNMRGVKEDLARAFKDVNTLVFRFRNVELVE